MAGFGDIPGLGEIAVLVSLAGADKFGKGLDDLTAKIKKGAITMDDVLNKALAAGTAAFVASTIAAAKFEGGMVDLKNTVDLTDDEFKAIEQSIKDIGSSVPLSLSALTGGMEQLLRAGFSTSDAISALEITSKAAVATHSDLRDVIGATTPIMKAYGLGVEDLESLLDMQNATLDMSNVSYQELESAMGKIIPQAQGLKIPIEELYGAFGFFSQYGLEASESGQKIAMALKSITEHRPEWEKLIGSIYDSQGNFIGLEALIKKLETRFKTMTPQAKAATLQTLELGRSRDIIQLAANNMDAFGEAIRGVADASGDTEKEFQEVTGTFTQQLAILKNNFEIAFVEIGKAVMPVLKDITGWLKDNPEQFQAIIKLVGELALAFGAVSLAIKGIEFAKVINGLTGLGSVIGTGSLGVVGAIAAATAAWLLFVETIAGQKSKNAYDAQLHMNMQASQAARDLEVDTENLTLSTENLFGETQKLGAPNGPVATITDLFGMTSEKTDELAQSTGSAAVATEEFAIRANEASGKLRKAKVESHALDDAIGKLIESCPEVEDKIKKWADETEKAKAKLEAAKASTQAWVSTIFELTGQLAGSDSVMKQTVATIGNIVAAVAGLITIFEQMPRDKITGNIKDIDLSFKDLAPSILAVGSALIEAFTSPTAREVDEEMRKKIDYFYSLAGQLDYLGIETEESVWKQINSYEALIPKLEEGSYEYQQVVDKLTALYDKLGLVNPLLEDQIGLVRLASIEWERYWQTFFTDFQEFQQNIAMAGQAIQDMLYFGVPMSETEVDEYIRTLIDDMAAYIETLDPTSQAYADAVQAYNDLIDQYNQMTQTLGDGSDELLEHYGAQSDAIADNSDEMKSATDVTNEYTASMTALDTELQSVTSHIWTISVGLDIDTGPLDDLLGRLGSAGKVSAGLSGPPGGTGQASKQGVNVIVNEATPQTWVEITDQNISPRIRYRERYMTNWVSPY
ncbi:MAG: phage tail tape measure protein [Acidobacteriia bacterium]|nr:phage tail tape measure protein [Terriglobia bacterium]